MRLKPLNQITVLLKRAVGLGSREPLASSCTSLVPYGTNLSSTVNIKLSPVSLKQLNLPSKYYSIVVLGYNYYQMLGWKNLAQHLILD
jgi:hypothetical protein